MNSIDSNAASLNVMVRGQVQGVYFRAFVRHHATALGLTGYTRNLRNERAVEVRAEGKREQLEKLVPYLHQGPPGARVEKVDVEWIEPTGDFSSFEIRF